MRLVIICSLFANAGLFTLPAYYAEQGLCDGRASVCPSVCLSHRSTAGTARRAGLLISALRQEISIGSCGRAAGAVLQATALSSKWV